eukprot:8031472-Alexandrium_andersonii.AAC.1
MAPPQPCHALPPPQVGPMPLKPRLEHGPLQHLASADEGAPALQALTTKGQPWLGRAQLVTRGVLGCGEQHADGLGDLE